VLPYISNNLVGTRVLGECGVNLIDLGRHGIREDQPVVRRQLLRVVLVGVLDDMAAILLVERQDATQVKPAVCLLRALDAHSDYQIVLRTQVDRKRVDLLNLGAAVDGIGRGPDVDVDLMRHAPHAR
jgi:hypothetical protein